MRRGATGRPGGDGPRKELGTARPTTTSRAATAVLSAVTLPCALALVAACESGGVDGGLDLERMVVQPSSDAYEASSFFEDGAAMRPPPDHVVAHESAATDPVVRTGRRGGAWVGRSPLGYPLALLERGRDRYGVFCAPCHGADGSAETPVADAMELTPPRVLIAPEVRALPDGHLYGVVRDGYGLMPEYGTALTVRDRWAVVGYVRALQTSAAVPLDSLPPSARRRATDALPDSGRQDEPGASREPRP